MIKGQLRDVGPAALRGVEAFRQGHAGHSGCSWRGDGGEGCHKRLVRLVRRGHRRNIVRHKADKGERVGARAGLRLATANHASERRGNALKHGHAHLEASPASPAQAADSN